MSKSLTRADKLLGLVAVLFFATACATLPPPAGAQGNVGTNIPVLVMSEDEDPTTVKRSSDIFKRVIAELQGAMQRHGFRMIDEESVAADLGWVITDRRPKRQLIETIKLMGKSNHGLAPGAGLGALPHPRPGEGALLLDQGADPHRRRDLRRRLQPVPRHLRDAARGVPGAEGLPGVFALHQRGGGRPGARDRGRPGRGPGPQAGALLSAPGQRRQRRGGHRGFGERRQLHPHRRRPRDDDALHS